MQTQDGALTDTGDHKVLNNSPTSKINSELGLVETDSRGTKENQRYAKITIYSKLYVH